MHLLQPSVLAFGLAASASIAQAQTQFLVTDLSFGHTGRINDRGQSGVPGFSIAGDPNPPEVLSNKVILTPPAPGGTKGSVWANSPNKYTKWTTDVDFRVNGPERGIGNINIWLIRDGSSEVGQSSIYTVNKFEGLALVIDQHSGSGGMIRGFLNDGTTDFRGSPSIDALAFGHCQYSYRNLGRASQIKLRQTDSVFKVEIDGRLCFESDKISIPPGYYFGVTAAAGDKPDSTELFKLVTMTENLADTRDAPPQQQNAERAQMPRGGQRPPSYNPPPVVEETDDGMMDTDASMFTSSEAQFTDLHNRIQGITHQVSRATRQVTTGNNLADTRHKETKALLEEVAAALSKLNQIENTQQGIQADLSKLARDVKDMRQDVRNKVTESERNMKSFFGSNHGTMLEHVATQATPRHGTLIFVIIGSQCILVAGYIYYERKKMMPKKYL